MNQAASSPTAADERPRLIIIGLIVWVLLQLPRLIAIPLIQDVLDGTESDAWMFPAILDVVVAVAAPFLAVALWRARGLWVWVTAIVFFTVSIVDHLDAMTAGLLAPPPQVFGGGSGPSPVVVPGLQLLVDVVALWLLLRPNVKRYYLDTTAPEPVSQRPGGAGSGPWS
jgi:hypothetical protein